MAIVVIVSLILHEYAHALTASIFGDPTPRLQGRLTLNPLVHFEPLGLIMILFAPIGWAKPVSVNASYFRWPRAASTAVALAGPVSNLVLACLCDLSIRLFGSGGYVEGSIWYLFIQDGAAINVSLCVFNLIPLPPLDGSRVVAPWLPSRSAIAYGKLEFYGPFILLIAIIVLRNSVFTPLFSGAQALVGSWFGV